MHRSRAGRRRATGEHGSVSLELALVAPILLTLVIGVVQFGVALNGQLQMSGAAREAARYMVANQGVSGVTAGATAAARAASPTLDWGNTTKIAFTAFLAGTNTGTGVCGTYPNGGDLQVTITQVYSLQTPFLTLGSATVKGIGDFQC